MPTKAATLLPVLAICAVLSAACAGPATGPPTETLPTATTPPVSTATPEPTSTPEPTDTPTPSPTPTAKPTSTPTLTPAPTATPTPYPQASFVHPVDLSVAPMYDAYDLDSTEGVIEGNAGAEYSFDGGCSGNWMVPHTIDNHPGYDYGSGMCGADVSGTPVNGMSVGYLGTVFQLFPDSFFAIYGPLLLPTGNVQQVILTLGHPPPEVRIGQRIDHTTTVAHLDHLQEVELQVMLVPPDLGLDELWAYVFDNYEDILADPRAIGLEPVMSYGPRE